MGAPRFNFAPRSLLWGPSPSAGLPSVPPEPRPGGSGGQGIGGTAWARGQPDTRPVPRGSPGGAAASPQPDPGVGTGLGSRSEADVANRKAPAPLQAADPRQGPLRVPGGGSVIPAEGFETGRRKLLQESSSPSQRQGSLSAQRESHRPGRAGGASRALRRRAVSVASFARTRPRRFMCGGRGPRAPGLGTGRLPRAVAFGFGGAQFAP